MPWSLTYSHNFHTFSSLQREKIYIYIVNLIKMKLLMWYYTHSPVAAGVYTLVSRRSDNCIFRRGAFFVHSFHSHVILWCLLIITTLRKKTVYNTKLKRFTLQSYSEDSCLLQFILSVRNFRQVCRSGVSCDARTVLVWIANVMCTIITLIVERFC